MKHIIHFISFSKCKLHFFVWFIMVLRLMVSNSVEPVKEKNFVAFGSWWRVELDADRTLYKISETFASVGFGVDISKLHA